MVPTQIALEIEVGDGQYPVHNGDNLRSLQDCPVEILIKIFEYYLADRLNRLGSLALVCMLWNSIARDTSTLWTHIVITTPGNEEYLYHVPLHLVRRSIQKSGDLPLDIDLDLSKIRLPSESEDFKILFDLLCDESHRWRSLYIILPQTFEHTPILSRLYVHPPRLVELGLQGFWWRRSQKTSFTDLPGLKMLVLDSGFAYKEMVTSFSLTSLESLDIDLHGFEMWNKGADMHTWPSDISLARSLRSLRIRCSLSEYNVRSPTTPLVLPLLYKLEIYKVHRIRGITCDLPTLRNLVFDSPVKPDPDLAQAYPTEEVVWHSTMGPSYAKLPSSDPLVPFAKAVISRYPSAKRFVFPAWSYEALADPLREMGVDLVFREVSERGELLPT